MVPAHATLGHPSADEHYVASGVSSDDAAARPRSRRARHRRQDVSVGHGEQGEHGNGLAKWVLREGTFPYLSGPGGLQNATQMAYMPSAFSEMHMSHL